MFLNTYKSITKTWGGIYLKIPVTGNMDKSILTKAYPCSVEVEAYWYLKELFSFGTSRGSLPIELRQDLPE